MLLMCKYSLAGSLQRVPPSMDPRIIPSLDIILISPHRWLPSLGLGLEIG
jgi:hypothetical protein